MRSECLDPEYKQDDCIAFIDSRDLLKKEVLFLVDCR